MSWDWPGNVRELDNVIERAVLLTRGNSMNLHLNVRQSRLLPTLNEDSALRSSMAQLLHPTTPENDEEERQRIVQVLRETNGIVAGPRGAATRLGLKRTTLLVLAVTLHNIPEGMAVGLACALAAGGGSSSVTLAGAMALCLGMGLQNFPEGAAISLPLRREGLSRPKSFVYGALSGIVEPIGGILAVLIAGSVTPLMPWFLSFAAGAMIYVVVEELIPEAHLGEHSHPGTLGVLAGFLVMMVLDVALG